MKVNLRNGNNTITMFQLNVADELSVRTGSGNDLIALQQLSVDDDISVSSGGGNDDVWLALDSSNKINVRTSSGNDFVSVSVSDVSELNIVAGSGNDELVLLDNFFVAEMTVRAGGGDDFVYSVNSSDGELTGGGGFDTVNRQSTDDVKSFESDNLDAVLAVCAINFNAGNSNQGNAFIADADFSSASVSPNDETAFAEVTNGSLSAGLAFGSPGMAFAIASAGTNSVIKASGRV